MILPPTNKVSLAIKMALEDNALVKQHNVPCFIRKASKGRKPPYIIIQKSSDPVRYHQQGPSHVEFKYIVKVISGDEDGNLGTLIAGEIDDTLIDKPLVMENHRIIGCWKLNGIEYPDPLAGDVYFHEGGIFQLDVA